MSCGLLLGELGGALVLGVMFGDRRCHVTPSSVPPSPSTRRRVPWVVPVSRVAMDTSSLLAVFGHPLTF